MHNLLCLFPFAVVTSDGSWSEDSTQQSPQMPHSEREAWSRNRPLLLSAPKMMELYVCYCSRA